MRTFGQKVPGKVYISRPAAQAVIFDEMDRVAVVRHKGRFFLPGGGLEAGESCHEGLHRELAEETGWQIEIIGRIGEASEYVEVPAENACFEKQMTFYLSRVVGKIADPTEPDHETVWVTLNELQAGAVHESHVWAVEKALDDQRR